MAKEAELIDAIDSVYLLMFAGWREELRSNRWHWARRLAQRWPVVLVQPELTQGRGPIAGDEPRIPNCRILSVWRPADGPGYAADAARATSDLARHMLEAGHRRPLLWLYNPWLYPAFAALPAILRIQHATESFFDFESVSPQLLSLHRRSLALADRVIAVSSGVADRIRREVAGAPVVEISNGCDYPAYAGATPSPALAAKRPGFERIAIYAGGIDLRLDRELLEETAARYPRTLFALYGPLRSLAPPEEAAWKQLFARPNVEYGGVVGAEQLPGLYAAADLGLLPYRRTPLVEDNAFPLKALEMIATGLPVVSTYMRPLEEIEAVIAMARERGRFLQLAGEVTRAGLGEDQRRQMEAVARAKDYHAQFARALGDLAQLSRPAQPVSRVDALLAGASVEESLAAIARYGEPCALTVERCLTESARESLRRARRAVVRRAGSILRGPR